MSKRRWLWLIPLVLLGMMTCLGPVVPPFDAAIQVFWTLVLGWVAFLWRTLPHVSLAPAEIAGSLLVLVCATVGLHSILAWMWRSDSGSLRGRWRWKWTIAATLILLLQFVVCIGFAGVIHQTAWLARSPEPIVTYRWLPGFELSIRLRRIGISEFADRKDLSAEVARRELFANPGIEALLDDYRIAVRGDDSGRLEFILVFPRQREHTDELGACVFYSDGRLKSIRGDELAAWVAAVENSTSPPQEPW